MQVRQKTGAFALITGASKGIGKAFAIALAKRGYNLILTARNTQALATLAEELQNSHDIVVKIITADLSEVDGVDKLLAQGSDVLNQVDILINNAGFGLAAKFSNMPYEELEGMLNVNIIALTQLCYRILPFMVAKGHGKILNVSSTAAYTPGPYMAIYYASKAYVSSLSESLYEEYKNNGITISVLCPGVTKTGFQARAGIEHSLMLNGMIPTMTAEQVAEIGVIGLIKGKRVIVPGFFNKLSIFFMWVMPNFINAKITAKLEKPADK